jgi:hypothetical protein
MSYQTINASELIAGQPTKESLFERIVNNLDYHEAQIQALGASGGQTIVFNQILKFPEIPVGTPIWTWDSLSNVKTSGFSKNWIDCAGSGTWTDGGGTSRNTPDARNRFLRMYNGTWSTPATNLTYIDTTKLPSNAFTGTTNNPNTSTVSGGFHSHFISSTVIGSSGSPTLAVSNYLIQQSTGDYSLRASGTAASVGLTGGSGEHSHSYPHTHTFTVSGGGDGETCPKHISLNLIFKSAYSWGSFRLLYKASSSFTITTVNLTKIEAGTAASVVTMDLRKATTAQLSAGSGDVSILSALPTITDNGSTAFVEAAGTIKTDGTEDISTNEWLFVNFTSKIQGVCEYHIQVVGS